MNFHKEILRASDVSTMSYHQKKAAAKDPTTTQDILQKLATDGEYLIRFCVAENPNTPQKTLEKLATDEDVDVRSQVARHPNCNQLIERLVFMTNYQQNQ